MKGIKELLNGKPVWMKILILVTAGAIAFTMSGCGGVHKVTQSSYNTSTGDSIVIKYEQYGKTWR